MKSPRTSLIAKIHCAKRDLALDDVASRKARLWGCFSGLAGQPFWFWSAYSAGQWAVMALAIYYTATYIRGVRNNYERKAT